MQHPLPSQRTHSTFGQNDIEFSQADFRDLAEILYQSAGINLVESKKSLVYARLTKRIRSLSLASFRQYLEHLRDVNNDEMDFLVAALTTNMTSFFREAHHFSHFQSDILPVLIQKAKKGERVRIWSSACSSGEEAYSIGLCILGACENAQKLDIKILGSDIDRDVLQKAQAGRYMRNQLAPVPEGLKTLIPDDGGEHLDMPEDLRGLVSFRKLNLMGEWPFSGQFDVIFCRNVAIYFDKPTQQRLWQRLVEKLVPGGTFYIGHSERITGPAEASLTNIGVTQYQKLPREETNGATDKKGAKHVTS